MQTGGSVLIGVGSIYARAHLKNTLTRLTGLGMMAGDPHSMTLLPR